MGDLASKVKALRAANTIETAPEMVVTPKAARAERPVTARIRARRRMETIEEPVDAKPKPVADAIPIPAKPEEKSSDGGQEPFESNRDYRQRVTARRQGPGLLRLF